MTKDNIHSDPYKLAGVDIDAGNDLIHKIKADVQSTANSSVLGGIGGFAGMYKLPTGLKNPILVACTDGVGTKVSLAQEYNKLDNIGQDLVAMCVNDLITCGASPMFFLDYFASSKLNINDTAVVIKSIASACKASDCALLGGETAEMPDHYIGNNFDLAGFSVGCVEESKVINGSSIEDGDVIIGVESSGPHSNGYSLIRKILNESTLTDNKKSELAEDLLAPTTLYTSLTKKILDDFNIKGMAHITGGGITENIPRIVPDVLQVEIYKDEWDLPKIFNWIKDAGNINMTDMYKIFNCGIGYVFIVSKDESDQLRHAISNEGFNSYLIGGISKKTNKEDLIYI